MKSSILFSEECLTPTKSRLDDLHSEMKRKNIEDFWGPKIDAWKEERGLGSLAWLYLKAMYTLRICKQLRVTTLNAADITLYEKSRSFFILRLRSISTGLHMFPLRYPWESSPLQ